MPAKKQFIYTNACKHFLATLNNKSEVLWEHRRKVCTNDIQQICSRNRDFILQFNSSITQNVPSFGLGFYESPHVLNYKGKIMGSMIRFVAYCHVPTCKKLKIKLAQNIHLTKHVQELNKQLTPNRTKQHLTPPMTPWASSLVQRSMGCRVSL